MNARSPSRKEPLLRSTRQAIIPSRPDPRMVSTPRGPRCPEVSSLLPASNGGGVVPGPNGPMMMAEYLQSQRTEAP